MNAGREPRVDCRLMEKQWLLMIMYVLIALTRISGAENARCGTGRAFFSEVKNKNLMIILVAPRSLKGFRGAGRGVMSVRNLSLYRHSQLSITMDNKLQHRPRITCSQAQIHLRG